MAIRFFFSFFFLSVTLLAQEVKLGEWRTHLPFSKANAVSENSEEIFCGTSGGLFTVNKASQEIERFSVIDGFTNSDIRQLKWNNTTQQLMIVYANANIDLLENGKIHNLPEIFEKNNIGRKNINAIYFDKELAYLSTAFGIVVYDLTRKEVKDSYFFTNNGLPVEVYEISILQNSILAATSAGLFEASLNDVLVDFSRWKKHAGAQNYPGGLCLSLVNFQEQIYGLFNNQIYKYNGSTWAVTAVFGTDVKKLKAENNQLLTIAPFRVISYDGNLNIIQNLQNTNAFSNATDAINTAQGIYIADNQLGLVKAVNSNYSYFLPKGPQSTLVKDLHFSNGKLVLSPGGFSENFSPLFNNDGFSILEQEEWKIYSAKDYPALAPIRDITLSYHQSSTKKTYLGSFVNGLIEHSENNFKIYNQTNSSLQTTVGDAATIRISGIAEDVEENLWISQFGAARPLSVKRSDGTWESFSFQSILPNSFTEIAGLLIDNASQKWLLVRNKGLIVFNGSQSKLINSNNGLPGITVNCIKKDNNGSLWIGTDKGIAIINNPDEALGNVQIEIPNLVENGFLRPLLQEENILSIAIDGANRKWISTNNGVWLFSEDGTKQIQNFNTKNSKLLSNKVADIEINEQTGEVFFATEAGLISYKGDATASAAKIEKVIVYPNPVRPGYKGEIGIKGLIDKAIVKITDINGSLVYQTIAKGGQATWDGRNFSGSEASSGVYLILISSEDGTDTAVSKIMIIR